MKKSIISIVMAILVIGMMVPIAGAAPIDYMSEVSKMKLVQEPTTVAEKTMSIDYSAAKKVVKSSEVKKSYKATTSRIAKSKFVRKAKEVFERVTAHDFAPVLVNPTDTYTPECSDGVNNDLDPWTDWPEDPGCSGPNDDDESDNAECSDGVDNDGDAYTDYPEDPGCDSIFDDDEWNGPPQCSDGVDNDLDGFTDYPDDPGCTSHLDNDETDVPITECNDGIDNDNDGDIDYPDEWGCSSPTDLSETPACKDGLDNDNDGLIDYPAEPGCFAAHDKDETDIPGCEAVNEIVTDFWVIVDQPKTIDVNGAERVIEILSLTEDEVTLSIEGVEKNPLALPGRTSEDNIYYYVNEVYMAHGIEPHAVKMTATRYHPEQEFFGSFPADLVGPDEMAWAPNTPTPMSMVVEPNGNGGFKLTATIADTIGVMEEISTHAHIIVEHSNGQEDMVLVEEFEYNMVVDGYVLDVLVNERIYSCPLFF